MTHREHRRHRRTITGQRCGEWHPRARVSDGAVAQVRALHEIHGLGYKAISRQTGLPRTTVRHWCNYDRRA